MSWRDNPEDEVVRIRLILLLMLAAFVFLGASLWRVQVTSSDRYKHSLDKQSMRRVRLPGSRGMVVDRNGICLADNRPSYCIAVYVEEFRKPGRWSRTIDTVDETLDRLATVLDVPRQVSRDDVVSHVKKRLPLPFLAWRDVTPTNMARLAESSLRFPGVDIYVEPVREYPFAALCSHVVGYVGRADPPQDPDEPYHFYLPEMEGKFGIERTYDEALAGVPGGYLLRVNASGFKHEKTDIRSPQPGNNIRLTLDIEVQKALAEAVGDRKGAGVVLDPSNGDVLGLFSHPAFDPNRFFPRIPREDWAELNNDPDRPLVNRAVAGAYPPGSTFKPLVAIAALEGRTWSVDEPLNCTGIFEIGNTPFRCWHRSGHGWVALRKALEQSCNAYFYQLGLRTSQRPISAAAEALGFGQKTGIDLAAEARGLVPSPEWKRRAMHEGWRPGDTCNLSIGQGALLVTPVQMAMYTAALANGGVVYRPRLVADPGDPGEVVRRMPWSPQALQVVRGGMLDVVQAPTGTGKRAQLPGIEMAGKTGTAEHGPREARRKYGWMILFAPFDRPRVAAALLIEDADSGGITVAPRMRTLMQRIFRIATTAPVVPDPEPAGELDT
jgi:penicillin-binding protein 2